MPNFTQPEFDNLTIDDLLKNVFTIDSNGRVCMRVLMIGQNIINWGQVGGTISDQVDLNAALTGKIPTSYINAANGVAGLGADGKLSTSLLPSIVFNDVKVVADIAARDAISMTDRQGLIVKVADRGDGKPSNYMWDIETTAWIMFADVSDVTSVNGYTGVINLTIADIPNLQTNLDNAVHKTGYEVVDGIKNFLTTTILGRVDANIPTGNRVVDLQLWAKNNGTTGGVHFSVIADADGAAIGNRALGIWGYPHRSSDGSIAGYERFIKMSFPTYDGNNTYTKLIELDAPIQVIDGSTLTIGTNITSNYKRLSILGNSDTTRMIEWGDGGVVWAGFGRTTTNEQYMDVSNYGGKDFEFRGKYRFRKDLRIETNTNWNQYNTIRIGNRYNISGILHEGAGHISQFLWGDNAGAPEGTGTDGGWGLEFGAHGNPYLNFIGTDTVIGRTSGNLNLRGITRAYGNAANSNHIAIWNDGTYNKIDSVGLPLAISGVTTILGTGRLLVLGDGAGFHDVNLANTLALKGEQNSNIGRLQLGASAYIQGNADGTLTLSNYTPWFTSDRLVANKVSTYRTQAAGSQDSASMYCSGKGLVTFTGSGSFVGSGNGTSVSIYFYTSTDNTNWVINSTAMDCTYGVQVKPYTIFVENLYIKVGVATGGYYTSASAHAEFTPNS